MSRTSRVLAGCVLLVAVAGPGCGDSTEGTGAAALLAITPEAAGSHCAHGGQKLMAGTDTNGNGKLDDGEVSSTEYACHGQPGEAGDQGDPGLPSLVAIRDEAPGTTCAQGGKSVDIGVDSNRNGVLDSGEVTQTQSVCNGVDGSDGTSGAPGAPGSAGLSSLLETAVEPSGSNCEHGGIVVRSGLDNGAGGGTGSNGALETGEVSLTQYVCHGAAGAAGSDGLHALIASSGEPAGEHCEHGGTKLEYGLDDGAGGGSAGNGELEAGEIDDTLYVCSGAPGSDGQDGAPGVGSTVVVSAEPAGGNCPTGGQKIVVGTDADKNGTLAGAEIAQTAYVCNAHYCGDGLVGGAEQCDDGNDVDGDDCTNACRANYIASYTGGGQTIYQMAYRALPSGDARDWYRDVCKGAGLRPVSCDPAQFNSGYDASAWGGVALNYSHYSCNVSSGIVARTGWSNVLTFHTPNYDSRGVCQNGCTITGVPVSPICTDAP